MPKKMDNGRDAIAWIRLAQGNVRKARKGITPRVSLEAAMREVQTAQKRLFWLVEDLTFEINKLEDSANPPSDPTTGR